MDAPCIQCGNPCTTVCSHYLHTHYSSYDCQAKDWLRHQTGCVMTSAARGQLKLIDQVEALARHKVRTRRLQAMQLQGLAAPEAAQGLAVPEAAQGLAAPQAARYCSQIIAAIAHTYAQSQIQAMLQAVAPVYGESLARKQIFKWQLTQLSLTQAPQPVERSAMFITGNRRIISIRIRKDEYPQYNVTAEDRQTWEAGVARAEAEVETEAGAQISQLAEREYELFRQQLEQRQQQRCEAELRLQQQAEQQAELEWRRYYGSEGEGVRGETLLGMSSAQFQQRLRLYDELEAQRLLQQHGKDSMHQSQQRERTHLYMEQRHSQHSQGNRRQLNIRNELYERQTAQMQQMELQWRQDRLRLRELQQRERQQLLQSEQGQHEQEEQQLWHDAQQLYIQLFEEQELQQQLLQKKTLRFLQEMAQKHDLALALALQLEEQRRVGMEWIEREAENKKRYREEREERDSQEVLQPELKKKRLERDVERRRLEMDVERDRQEVLHPELKKKRLERYVERRRLEREERDRQEALDPGLRRERLERVQQRNAKRYREKKEERDRQEALDPGLRRERLERDVGRDAPATVSADTAAIRAGRTAASVRTDIGGRVSGAEPTNPKYTAITSFGTPTAGLLASAYVCGVGCGG
ncbi:hypothetical protein B484DRAFT_256592 [Ochromonadaceae sp. CCMP2298]|nr:hypothetical protein B484DRAFT_256592 [Ochromonadaceae sp. CCMP2298]